MPERTCSIEGCSEPHHARGWCKHHYWQWWRHGVIAPQPSEEEHFWNRVNRCGPDDCWLWTGFIDPVGYGQVWWHGRSDLPHRIAYELTVGPIPDGLTIDHVKANGCMSKACCNPRHLEPVTCRENILRGSGPTAQNVLKTHCPQGHPYDSGNTRITPNGHRACRACAREMARRRRKEHPEAVREAERRWRERNRKPT